LQAVKVIVFEPADAYDVENVVPELDDDGEPPFAVHVREVTAPEVVDEQFTDAFTFTDAGEQLKAVILGASAGGSWTLTVRELCTHTFGPLQARKVIVFEPADAYDVENVVPELDDDGEPPPADHVREVTVPEVVDEQFTDSFTFTDGEQLSDVMAGAFAGGA